MYVGSVGRWGLFFFEEKTERKRERLNGEWEGSTKMRSEKSKN